MNAKITPRNYSAKMKFLRTFLITIEGNNVEALRAGRKNSYILKNGCQAGKIKKVEMEVSDKTFDL
ncbi:MAG TPA: hypothetical protein PKU87_04260 [Candidatus Atribacteria bacterium]|nr:hypothetical protein [Candidatus Atribacteria bacterium]